MKQINKNVSGAGFTAGKVVSRYKDGSLATADNLVGGVGGINRFLSDSDKNTVFCKLNETYYILASAMKEDTICFINIKLYKRNAASFAHVKSFEFNVGTNLDSVRAASISLNRIMFAYKGASNHGKTVVMTFDPANETVSFTAEYTFLAANLNAQLDIIKTDDNRCMIAYGNNNGYLNTVIATFLAPDIIFGTSVQLSTFVAVMKVRIVQHDTGKFLIVNCHDSGLQLLASHVNVVGSSVTLLHQLTLQTSVSSIYGLDVQVLGVNKVVVVVNDNVSFSHRTTLLSVVINGTNQVTLAATLDTGFGGINRTGLAAYDKTNKSLYVFHDISLIQKYVFDDVTNTFTEALESRQTNNSRLILIQNGGTNQLGNSRVIPLSDTQFIFVFAASSVGYTGGKFFLFDSTKIDKPEILGVAINASEYVVEGVVSGLTGLIAGQKYFANTNSNLVSEKTRESVIPTIYGLNVNSSISDVEDSFVGIAISPTELVIPNRKKKTYVRSVPL